MLKLLSHRATPAAALVIALTAALGLTACTSPGSGTSGTADTGLYEGELPPPAALPPAAELPQMPSPPEDANDSAAAAAYNDALAAYAEAYQKQQPVADAHQEAVEQLAQTAAKGGKDAVAAWESMLVVAGIAVDGPDGTPVALDGDTGAGWPMGDAELRLHSALAADPDGFMLSDLAHVLSAGFGEDDDTLTQQLYDALQNIPDHGFWEVFWSVGPKLYVDNALVAPQDVFLDWAQVELVLRRLSVEAAVEGADLDPSVLGASFRTDGTSPGVQPASARSGGEAAAASRACQNDAPPWKKELLNQFDKVYSKFVFGPALKAAEAAGVLVGAGQLMSLAGTVSTYATLMAKATSLEASYSLDSAPLVRTKNTKPGEVRELHLAYSFNPVKWDKVAECLNLFLTPLGITLPSRPVDPPAGIEVQLATDDPSEVLVGDGTGTDPKVDLDQTDADGKVSFKLSGAPRSVELPKEASPVDLTVGLSARNNLSNMDFLSDMGSLPWDAAGFVKSGGTNLIPGFIERSKFITTHTRIPVRDWKLDADFQVTAIGTLTGRAAYDIGWSCGDIAGKNQSSQEKGTFTTDPVDVSALLVADESGNLGDQAFVFVPLGDDFTMREVDQSGVGMFPMPVHYSVEKSTSSPGTGPMPAHRTDTTDCSYGGNGNGSSDTIPSDCGARDYDSTLQVTVPKPRTLYAAGDQIPTALGGQLWLSCGDPLYPFDPVVAPWYDGCYTTPTVSGGGLPSMADIADPSVRHFQVEGSYSCSREKPGELLSTDYSWTLDFCRLKDGKPDC